MALDEEWDRSGLVGKVADGRYLIGRVLHKSARAEIYEAVHNESGRAVALKVLLAHPARDSVEQYVRDRKSLAPFGHPHIVDVLELGKLDIGSVFVVTELVRGEPLSALIKDKVLDQRRALAIVRQVLDAVRAAHAVNTVHRDLQPEHIMVARGLLETDLIRVLGFGLARLQPAATSTFADPRYIAPEHVLEAPGDARADLYSLGALLFELLTGHTLFHAKGASALMRLHAYAPAQTLHQRAPERSFTPELEHVVATALEKRPEQRFQSAAAMSEALDAAVISIEQAEAAARAAEQSKPKAPTDDSLALLARDLMPHTAQAAAEPIVPVNVGRQVRELPRWARAQKLLRTAFAKTRSVANKAVAAFRRLDRKRQLIVAGVGGALLLTLVIAVAISGGKDNAKANTASVDARKQRADAQLARGHDHIANGRAGEGLAAYELALAASPDVATDARLLGNIAQAATAGDMQVRQQAMAIAEQHGIAVDRVASWALDLEQEASCDVRRELIGKLRTAGDKRALPALRNARSAKCVAREASAAIAALEGKRSKK